jgi:UDP-glucuronate 4-epimerase
MTEEKYLVTGGLGCIGAWVVRNLVRERVPVSIFDLASASPRLELILSPEELQRVRFFQGDISDLEAVQGALQASQSNRIIHLAALQVPFCKANPSLGARVNVVGTVNVFEAAKQAGLKQVVYASSVAVYGLNEDYPEHVIGHTAQLKPRTHYGVYKQANEGAARIYWLDDGLSSIGLRPYTLYGPGRDQGMTSSPTKAMLAAAAGRPYHIAYGGRSEMQYTDDVARMFIQAARTPFQGAEAFNLRGSVASMAEVVAAIEAAEPSARGRITFEPIPLPLPEEFDDAPLRGLLGSLPDTPLAEGVQATIEHFRQALQDGRLSYPE